MCLFVTSLILYQ